MPTQVNPADDQDPAPPRRAGELRLSDELAACEARLAAHAPPRLPLDRDELMYRAGWAAAEARAAGLATAAALPAPRAESRRTILAWSTTSGLAAAALAVVATLAVTAPAPRSPELAAVSIAPVPPSEQPKPEPPRAAFQPGRSETELAARLETWLGERSGRPRSLTPAALLGMGPDGDLPGLNDLAHEAPSAASASAIPPATARELLQEFLPHAVRPPAGSADSPGAILRLLTPATWGKDTI
ncbi:MAG TPA: hypothetical protein VEQ85_09740 [Lacipirellulaceae bacterium]|nr:hypothetical protein [Lacipirellulaceae bacterium]